MQKKDLRAQDLKESCFNILVLHEKISTRNNKNPLDNKTWMYMEH